MASPTPLKTAVPQPKQNRMTLASITKGKRPVPFRLLIHGIDGIGKSSFAASAPNPVFLGPEDGTNHLDVARFPVPTSWEDVIDALRTLATDKGGFETLVVDSLDWL
ncbi:MAG: AAA family ATPase, partial [Deltaproteobacteria bacterium]